MRPIYKAPVIASLILAAASLVPANPAVAETTTQANENVTLKTEALPKSNLVEDGIKFVEWSVIGAGVRLGFEALKRKRASAPTKQVRL